MNKESLEQERDEAEKKFIELQSQEGEIQKEMLREQGKYHLAVKLLNDLSAKKTKPSKALPASE